MQGDRCQTRIKVHGVGRSTTSRRVVECREAGGPVLRAYGPPNSERETSDEPTSGECREDGGPTLCAYDCGPSNSKRVQGGQWRATEATTISSQG
jgi:hypothetical protein